MATQPSLPNVSYVLITTAATNVDGTTYTAFASHACTQLDIVNGTGTAIEYRRGGSGSAISIPDGSSRLVVGITNANQISVRRKDVGTSSVTVAAEAFTL